MFPDIRFRIAEVFGSPDEKTLKLERVGGGLEDVGDQVGPASVQASVTATPAAGPGAFDPRPVWAHLRAPWAECPLRPGDVCHLIVPRLDEFDGALHALVDGERGFFILSPDLLLSGTRVASSHDCVRRSVLEERIGGSGTNDKAVKGTLLHILIQVGDDWSRVGGVLML